MDPVGILVWLAIIVIAILVIWYLLTQLELPEPARKIITIVLVVFVAVMAIIILLQLGGQAPRLR